MTRKTVMHRETEVFVVEEKLAPRKEAIKRRVKLERCIAAGINLGAMILTGGALVKIGLMVFAVIDSRTGGLGGEVLVFPALAMMFLWGREIGLGEARREAEAMLYIILLAELYGHMSKMLLTYALYRTIIL